MANDQTNSPFEKLLSGAQLPGLPQSAIRLFELSQESNNSSAEFAVPIESDPGLTSQILRFLNSSYFGFPNEISSIKLAISMAGIRTIKNFALWSAVFSLIPNPRCGSFDLKKLWQDSLRRAIFARRYGKLLGLPDAEELFVAALLQDMAVPLLAKELPAKYELLFELRLHGQFSLSGLEASAFGWTHADAGAYLARQWHLPKRLASLIQSHCSLDEQLLDASQNREALAISLSALLPTSVDDEWWDRERFLAAYDCGAPVDAPSIETIFQMIDDEYRDFAPILRLAEPVTPLAEWLEPNLEHAESVSQVSRC